MAGLRALSLLAVAASHVRGVERACPLAEAGTDGSPEAADDECFLLQLGAVSGVQASRSAATARPVSTAHLAARNASAPPTPRRQPVWDIVKKINETFKGTMKRLRNDTFQVTNFSRRIYRWDQQIWEVSHGDIFGPLDGRKAETPWEKTEVNYDSGNVTVTYATPAEFFTLDPVSDWMTLVVVSIALITLDMLVLRKLPKTAFNHGVIVSIWVFAGILYFVLVWIARWREDAIAWMTGYLLEWMLSVDNLFVFHLIFQKFGTPPECMHKALYIGIVGAMLFRLIFFFAMSSILEVVEWFRVVLGAVLIYSGIQAARDDEEETDPSTSRPVQILKACLGGRLLTRYEECNLIARDKQDGRLCVTLLFLVVCCLEITDILFAVDSVSAKIGQVPDPYLCYSSSVVAMFGLRGMFFIVHDCVKYFELLKYGLCVILMFIGIELAISIWVHLPSSVVLVVIVSVFAICIVGSRIKESQDQDGGSRAESSH